MSFILDALKKSEREREQQAAPSLPDMRYTQRVRNQPLWIVAVAALLLLNLGALALMWLRSTPQPAVPTQITVNNLPSPANPAPTTSSPPSSEVRPLAAEPATESTTEEGFDEDRTAALLNDALPDGPQLVRAVPPSSSTTLMTSQPVLPSAAAQPTTSNDGVPLLESLGGTPALNLPPLHLDIHVYADAPSGRFVFVNMRKYTEGQSLKEGPMLERITRDGVILNHQNQRFQLSRQ